MRLAVALLLLVACDSEKSFHSEKRTRGEAKAQKALPTRIKLEHIVIPPTAAKLHVAWKIPPGTSVNEDAPFRLRWRSSEGLETPPEDVRGAGRSATEGFDLDLKPTAGTEQAELLGDVEVVVCDANTHKVCLPVHRVLELTFAVKPHAPASKPEVPLPEATPQ